jgi:uncharacterized protein YndB with AHSA1/START domain
MTTPDVPLSLEVSFEVPGTPEQVWEAIATAPGVTAWFVPTELEEREGGAITFHMGADMESSGSITRWEPPRRLEYEEPEWTPPEHAGTVTPLVTEFLVEAQSGGSCVVKIVSSAFGRGADWEQEFFDEMGKGWRAILDNLRLYLVHFPGQVPAVLSIDAALPGTPDDAWRRVRAELSLGAPGSEFAHAGVHGTVERVDDDPRGFLVRSDGDGPGLVGGFVFAADESTTMLSLVGRFFGDDAPAFVQRIEPEWNAWVKRLSAEATVH